MNSRFILIYFVSLVMGRMPECRERMDAHERLVKCF